MSRLLELLRDPAVAGLDVDSADRLAIHGRILAGKPMLHGVFRSFHQLFNSLDQRFLSGTGLRLELGAGVAPMRDSFADVLATDIVAGTGLDMTLDAEHMALAPASVRVIFGQNCFHHFPHPELFLRELERVLVPGGGAILLEPSYGPFASFLYKRLFKSEGFDKDFPDWHTPASGPMHGANQALSYIVFMRDRARFTQDFPTLEIVHQQFCDNYLQYLCSGGLNFRQLWPDWALPLLKLIEWLLTPLLPTLALHHIIVLRKTGR
jgi:SAM-dependent methyltransferase